MTVENQPCSALCFQVHYSLKKLFQPGTVKEHNFLEISKGTKGFIQQKLYEQVISIKEYAICFC